jgi:hypothetical protein
VNWRAIGASALGTAHCQAEQGCQDYHFFDTLSLGAHRYFIALAADGAGSAPYGDLGAELACKAGFDFFRAALADSDLQTFNVAIGQTCLKTVRQRLQTAAESCDASFQDLACTLIIAVIGPTCAYFMQIGDGAIVIAAGDCWSIVFWPQAGPYANMTPFVTDEACLQYLQITQMSCCPDKLALFTDGLQRLALVFESQTVHAPFFEPMFDMLQCTPASKCLQLQQQLAEFLNSPSVNERTDDDKTLILAVRSPG